MTARRLECEGPGDRPCLVHAWWYYAGFGRPVRYCDRCRSLRRSWRRRCPECGFASMDRKTRPHRCEERRAAASRGEAP